MIKTFLLIGFLAFSLYGISSNYYIDENAGNDSNNGLSKSKAWRSLEHVNSVEFQPGDSILFKRGGKWKGTLKPQGNGAVKNRILIGAYGKGAAPIIDAEGKKQESDFISAAILLFNQEYWEIRDIEVRNFEKGNPVKPTKKAGILVLAKDAGTLHDFRFENLMIKDVNGSFTPGR